MFAHLEKKLKEKDSCLTKKFFVIFFTLNFSQTESATIFFSYLRRLYIFSKLSSEFGDCSRCAGAKNTQPQR